MCVEHCLQVMHTACPVDSRPEEPLPWGVGAQALRPARREARSVAGLCCRYSPHTRGAHKGGGTGGARGPSCRTLGGGECWRMCCTLGPGLDWAQTWASGPSQLCYSRLWIQSPP